MTARRVPRINIRPSRRRRTLVPALVLGAAGFANAAGDPNAKELNSKEAESQYLANVTQLTDTSMGLGKAGEAYFSPDGRRDRKSVV